MSADRPLPFSIRLLLGYLVVSALAGLGGLADRYFNTPEYVITRDDLWALLIGSFYLLLVPQVLVRSIAARISLTVVFSVQIAAFLANYALQVPDAWTHASTLGRFQEIGRIVFFSIYLALLNRAPVTEILRR